MKDFSRVAKALGDPTRVRMLKMLEGRELCVCHLTERLGLAQSSVSKHLGVLRRAGLVVARRSGHWVHYRLETQAVNAHNLRFLELTKGALNDIPVVREDKVWQPDLSGCGNGLEQEDGR